MLFYAPFILLSLGSCYAAFSTVDQAAQYVSRIAEFPEARNDDLEHPDYGAYYRTLRPSWWLKLSESIGLQAPALWKPSDFLKLLNESISHPTNNLKKGSIELSLLPGDKVLLLGSLHGSIHSLVRTVTSWYKAGIIESSFKIKDPRTFIVCLGNAIDYSAYSLETLYLLMLLLRLNEDRFFYLKGVHEDKRVWQEFSLYNELKYRLPFSSLKQNSTALDTFFTLLPTTVIGKLQGTKESLAFTGTADELTSFTVVVKGTKQLVKADEDLGLRRVFHEDEEVPHWTSVSAPIKLYRMYNNFFYDSYVEILLNDSLSTSTISLYFNQGKELYTKGPSYNLVTGLLIEKGNSPTPIGFDTDQKRDLKTIGNHVRFLEQQIQALEQSVGSFGKQFSSDFRGTKGPQFLGKQSKSFAPSLPELNKQFVELEHAYNSLAGDYADLQERATKRGLQGEPFFDREREKTLLIGSTLDLSKSVKGLGIPFKTGISLRIHKQNKEGGIKGKRVQALFLDDEYNPALSRRNIEQLLYTYSTPFILAPLGTPTVRASLDLIRQNKVLILFPQSGSPLFRDPHLTHIVNYRASFEDEGRILTDFVLKSYLPTNFAFFYQDDTFGTTVLRAAQRILEKEGVVPGLEVGYRAQATFFADAAQRIKSANPDVIGFFATGPATLQLIKELGVEFLAQKVLYGVSSVADEATVKVLKEKGLSLITGQVVPNPSTSKKAIVKEYREQIKEYGQRENVFSLEAYIVTSITLELMKEVEGSVTVDKLIKKIESLKQYSFKGLMLDFNPKNRSLAHDMWIDTGQEKWIKKKIEDV